ncbi:Tetratricopeptide repeat (TPR)-like superfamily protein [Arabidopsis thaliana]|uniref:At1g07280/F22G5_32 n=2 Tax=Arabidopsis thaliana TaxID=3702 RepID=Q8VZC8_ARATH|nr:Tetratricopeptide repeat (TPR)-like superfamily protein [Arabidopsis thaliana]NP_001117242.1 Tetratricopeptide repeat (TPR)-like superfamily protein [Arabidopsis thaliana]NP_172208.2 Tetratricopeptide repeat (TPR)-like superfamily protein [Arabidopsis thaliana]AAL57695.1 At1g07280/F22G5_32 [Arabidopsis thaliana]AAM91404.1 At1g07280/F22G5_32 [Arabidopsis thaliana]AEE28100.1 Tetratricopeptide repeat (TPR)-like superfamily protein [Arabidopsis thaliana]AEE28101.1 Tetratricopeptide repeat (TPR|eukprot:NP_001030984.1 Tetratricopeptide repeat (TPR)-like superfamily protein [Arabidopsis thaliana]
MGVKVATSSTFHQWVAHPIVHHSSSLSQTLASSAVSSPSRRRIIGNDGRSSLSCRSVMQSQRLNPSSPFGTSSTNLRHSKSCELWESTKRPKTQLIRRAFSANVDPFSEEEFAKKMQELTLKFQVSNEEEDNESDTRIDDYTRKMDIVGSHNNFRSDSMEPPWPEMVQMSNIERKANSVDLPLSLRIIKRKLQMEEGVLNQVGESACCSVKKAFSSMVFMIRELQSFTLHMRELLLFEDLQGILHRVRKEMQASFVWLFQQVFSATPTLMVSVMILLANFTVYSIESNSALAAAVSPPTTLSFSFETTAEISETQETNQKFDSSMVKTFSVSSPYGKTSFVGGGGGNNIPPPVQSGTDGDGSDQFRKSQFSSSSLGATSADSDVSVSGQEEIRLWNSILEETAKMETLDHETMKGMVSPVEARLEAEESMDYFKTELLYQTGLSQEPGNVLLLANYAQFLYLIIHDYDRAEKYFKRAAKAEPADAEALNKYATFLWRARNDIWRAEETYLEAISADPTNSVYSANYAHFLWNTGGDETCFPLDAPSQQNNTT